MYGFIPPSLGSFTCSRTAWRGLYHDLLLAVVDYVIYFLLIVIHWISHRLLVCPLFRIYVCRRRCPARHGCSRGSASYCPSPLGRVHEAILRRQGIPIRSILLQRSLPKGDDSCRLSYQDALFSITTPVSERDR